MTDQRIERRRLSGGAIAALVGLGALVVFVVQNTDRVEVHFFNLTFSWPLWLYTIVTAALGAVVWFGLGLIRRRRRRARRQAGR
ncbi:MAG TPA: LapA family protein [Natronosporangium sp.]|nr:LapA family protein [Natronosporangium sp.]